MALVRWIVLALVITTAALAHAQPLDAGVDGPSDAGNGAQDAGTPPAAPGRDAGASGPVPGTGAPDAGTPPATPGDAGASGPAPTGAQATLEPPKPIGATDVPFPAGAPAITAPVVVTVKLLVDKDGLIQRVELVTSPQPVFDDAVVAAAKAFRFTPATFDGKPVKVEITFTHTFVPPAPPPPPAAQGPRKTAVLAGRLVQLGTRAPVPSATLTAEVRGTTYSTEADDRGQFRLELPAGPARIAVYAPAHAPFVQQETLAEHQELAVTYYVERERYDPYEIVIVGEQRREEVSRITLRGPEIQQVPGTFGDPFRVIQTLPGVASVASLLPFPVVRGASPSSTGFLIDGTRVPLLFHLLSGPSVIHPELIDEIEFYPGGAPAPYGGYTAGIVDGRTRRARKGEQLIDADANLLQVGTLVRQQIGAANVTAAGRYGYPGFLLSLATNQASLSYWDYQLRVDGGSKANGWTVFAFGARDQLDTVAPDADPMDPDPPLEPSLILGFHRLDLRYHRTRGKLETLARLVGGYDRTFSNGTSFSVWLGEPQLRLRYKYNDRLTLAAGLAGSARSLDRPATAADGAFATITRDLSTAYTAGAYAEALWRPSSRWLVRPGIRGDVYRDQTATKPAVDPRLTVRYKLAQRTGLDAAKDSDDSAIWLKGAAGIYHQPPRFVVPLPGLDQMPLKYGLLRAYQTSVGVEVPLAERFLLVSDAFFNYMNPTIFDLSVNAADVGTDANTTLFPTEIVTGENMADMFIERLTKPQTGRAYGLEVLLRRSAKNGVFGWVSYTLSRSERRRGTTWAPYDFDRSHLLNLVMGMPLRRNWDVGVRVSYQSGLPATTTAGYNTARADGYLRFDVRVDKRAVWRKWLLDFYVDITNVALLPEEVTPGNKIRYVLPTLGLRGRF